MEERNYSLKKQKVLAPEYLVKALGSENVFIIMDNVRSYGQCIFHLGKSFGGVVVIAGYSNHLDRINSVKLSGEGEDFDKAKSGLEEIFNTELVRVDYNGQS